MEKARLHLKLSGDPQNTVFIDDVIPAQLAVYAFMHGEECVQSLTVTEVDKEFEDEDGMMKLLEVFQTDNALNAVKQLFPGMRPHMPRTFHGIGYDPDVLAAEPSVLKNEKNSRTKSKEAEKAIKDKLKKAARDRKSASPAPIVEAELEDEIEDGEDQNDLLDDELDELDETGGDLDDTGDEEETEGK